MNRWMAAFAAAGICLFVTLTLWTARTGGQALHVADLTGSAALALLLALTGWAIGALLTRDADRRGLIALVTALWALAFSTFQILATAYVSAAFVSSWAAGGVWTAVCAGLIWLIARSRTPLPFVGRVLAIAAVFLLGREALSALSSRMRSGTPPAVSGSDARSGTPDVYVIVLDKYSSGAWLRHSYGVDQTPLEDSLRAMGFVVPLHARANYAHTQISLASFLNWRYFDADAEDAATLSWSGMGDLIENAAVWQSFRKMGYRVVAFPTTFTATRRFPNADLELRPPGLVSSRLPMTFWSNSPFASIANALCGRIACPWKRVEPTPYPIERLADLEWKLSTLASLPDSVGPTFAFLHVLAPHEPYLFSPDCSPRDPWWPLSDQGDQFDLVGQAYADQVRCLGPLLLKTVRTIVERSSVSPVIVLQGDHGHGRIAVDPLRGFTLTADELTPERIGDRLGVFAAYRFPGADTLVRDDISAVNAFPLIIAGLGGDKAELQADRSYWSSYQSAFSFTELAPHVTRAPAGVELSRANVPVPDAARLY